MAERRGARVRQHPFSPDGKLLYFRRGRADSRDYEFHRGRYLAADRKRAYGLMQRIGRDGLWAFDVAQWKRLNRTPFEGPPRADQTTSLFVLPRQ